MSDSARHNWLLAIPITTVIFALLVIPVGYLLWQSLAGSSFKSYYAFLNSPLTQQALVRTLRVSALSTLLAAILSYPLAYYLARSQSKYRILVLSICIFPVMVHAIARVYGWTVVLGQSGLINEMLNKMGVPEVKLIHNEVGIIIGLVHLLSPYMILSLTASFKNVDSSLEEAAKSLGAGPAYLFRRILLPLSLPGLVSGALMVFTLSMTAFATPLLLGGARMPVLTTIVYQYGLISIDWQMAAMASGMLLLLSFSFVFLYRRIAATGLKWLGT